MLASRDTYNYKLIILAFVLVSPLLYGLAYFMGWVNKLPQAELLQVWDADFYAAIRDNGYQYDGKELNGNTGFFPLFAYLWRWTGLGVWGISILNTLLTLTSVYALCRCLKPKPTILLIFLANPLAFLLFLPFSEALFFACSTAILCGIIRGKNQWVFIGLFLASLTRPSALFLIPAAVGMYFMATPLKEWGRSLDWRTLLKIYLLPIVLGISLVLYIQYWQTGEWGIYFETQRELWKRTFNWPTFPLGRGAHDYPILEHITRFALWLGMFVALQAIILLYKWLSSAEKKSSFNRAESFSLIYLSMILLSIVFFNPTWYWHGSAGSTTTTLVGINRYIFPNAFFLVAIHAFYEKLKPNKISLLWLFLFSNLVVLCLEPRFYVHIGTLGFMYILLALVVPFAAYFYWRNKFLGLFIVLYSLSMQLYVFHLFLNGVQIE